MYVTRRRNRVLRKTNQPPLDPAKSNPSKRHRERLNGELEHLASLLPFEDSVIAKLDKLSVLRLAVSYLRAKSYYKAISPVNQSVYSSLECDVDTQLRAFNGFIMVIDPNGEVFYVSETVEQYLGFHQSDILHQSVLELVHSEDRENLSQQLNWSHLLLNNPATAAAQMDVGNSGYQMLHRSLIVRFRCLLDNTSGFITMEISGHLKPLYGQTGMNGLSLFAVCTPFGPVPMGDLNLEDITFRSKHKLDMSIVSLDPRGKMVLGELDSRNSKIYNLLHPMDVQYFADAHREMLKTGSSGLVAYRLMGKDGNWLWLQTSARVVYRNSKPDYLMCFHRNLTEEDGSNLIGKRNIEFTMPQLHAEPLTDDGEYVEEIPRAVKTRKSHKKSATTATQNPDPYAYEITPSFYTKDYNAVCYPFQGLTSVMPQHAQVTYPTQFYDNYGFMAEGHTSSRAYPLDYWQYHTNPLHTMLPMNSEGLTLAMGSHTYPDDTCRSVLEPSDSISQSYPTPITAAQCRLGFKQQTSILNTDVNSNPLLSFREMTYPLLNQ